MEILGKIRDASIQVATRDRRKRKSGLDGCIIEFLTDDNVIQGALVRITLEEMNYHFNVKEIEISGKQLLCSAQQTGYWVHQLKRKEGFDLRTLLEVDVSLITDLEEIAQIRLEACWC